MTRLKVAIQEKATYVVVIENFFLVISQLIVKIKGVVNPAITAGKAAEMGPSI